MCVLVNFQLNFGFHSNQEITQWRKNKNPRFYSHIRLAMCVCVCITVQIMISCFNVIHRYTCTFMSIHEYAVLYIDTIILFISFFSNIILHPVHVKIYVDVCIWRHVMYVMFVCVCICFFGMYIPLECQESGG